MTYPAGMFTSHDHRPARPRAGHAGFICRLQLAMGAGLLREE